MDHTRCIHLQEIYPISLYRSVNYGHIFAIKLDTAEIYSQIQAQNILWNRALFTRDAVGCVFRCEFAGKIYLLLFFQIFHSTIASILPLNRFDYKSLNFFFQNRSKSGEVLSKHRRTISLRKRQVTQTNHLMRFLYLDLHFFCWP